MAEPRDIHAPYVDDLARDSDWAGLVRYWMAHQYEPALDAAILAVRNQTAHLTGPYAALNEYLMQVRANPVAVDHKLAPNLDGFSTQAERATIKLLALYSAASLCELALQFRVEIRTELLHSGIATATMAQEIAMAIPDNATAAFFCGLGGRAYLESARFEVAQDRYRQALGLYHGLAQQRPAVYQPYLALTINNLANVLRKLNQLEAARDHRRQALELYRELAREQPEAYEPNLADTLQNLGNNLANLNQLEAACDSYREALRLYRSLAQRQPEVYRSYVAITLNNLGAALLDLKRLDEARDSLREALASYRELARQKPEVYQSYVAMTLHNLGNVLRALKQPEASHDHYLEALALYRELARQQPEVYQPALAMTLYNLGNVLSTLNQLEGACESHREALRLYRELARQRPEVHRSDVAKALLELGNVLCDLGQLEAACDSCREALGLYRELAQQRPEVYRAHVAATLNDFGDVLSALKEPETAGCCYREALTLYRNLAEQRPEVHQPDIAWTLNNLGTLFLNVKQLDLARDCCREALGLYRELAKQQPEIYQSEVAMALRDLGNVLCNLGQLEAACDCCREALGLYRELAQQRPEVHRPNLARTLNDLGNVLCKLNQLKGAYDCYQEALALYKTDAVRRGTGDLVERLRTHLNLGELLRMTCPQLDLPDYRRAQAALHEARTCAELLRKQLLEPRYRLRMLGLPLKVYELLLLTCVDLWSGQQDHAALQEAVEVGEANRARQLMDLLAEEVLQPANTPPDLVKEFRQLRHRLRQAQHALQAAEERLSPALQTRQDPVRDLRNNLKGLTTKHNLMLQRIRQHDPEFDLDRLVPPVSISELRLLIPTDLPTALVQYTVTREGGLALILTSNQLLAIRLPKLSDSELSKLAGDWFDRYYGNESRHEYVTTQEAAEAAAAKEEMARAAELKSRADQLGKQWILEWGQSLTSLLEPIAERAINPLVETLYDLGVKRLILSPNHALHVYPLHACRLPNARYLTDEFEVVYTPSFSILHRCVARQRPRSGRALLLANPTGDLPFAEVESEAVRRRFPRSIVMDFSNARKEHVLRLARHTHMFHYSGHTMFSPNGPLDSALVFGSRHDSAQWLSLREIFCTLNLRRNSLAVLNGCESGMLLPNIADEYVNLPTGFLFAGATCVIGSLWALHDISSAMLIDRFYREWQRGRTVASALREAQRWLREDITNGSSLLTDVLPPFLKNIRDPVLRKQCEKAAERYAHQFPNEAPFASPVHWAAFTAIGFAYSPTTRP
jgi:CHAT domain-containing protein/translation initiation factor 2B subunit (eIF-2B alpha/beta/delta family)